MSRHARAEFREATDRAVPGLTALWLETLEGASRLYTHEVKCKCGLRHRETFQVPDLMARTRAAEALLANGWGRPPLAEPERDLAELVEREPELLTAEERRVLLAEVRARLANGDGKEARR